MCDEYVFRAVICGGLGGVGRRDGVLKSSCIV